MKYVKLFEQFTNEKVYRLTGPYASKGIIGKVMQAFKKRIERIQFEGDFEPTLAEVNKEWQKFEKDAIKMILADVEKAVKTLDNVAYVHVDGLKKMWQKSAESGLNRHMSLPGDFVINVGFNDDVDGSKFSRKLDGSMNTPIFTGEDIYGAGDDEVGYNNVEIRGRETMMLDEK